MFFNRLDIRSDEELMTLIKQGHERAFTALYKRYSAQMLRYFFRMLWKDEARAQDCLQDLFMKIVEKPEYFDLSRKFSTWLYSVAHNMCKNEYRKENYRRSVSIDNHDAAIENTIHEQLDHDKFNIVLQRTMVSWNEDDRSLFVLRHELEMTFSEIGVILNCPEGTAKSRWFYLRKNLAAQLHEFQPIIR
jgi:RNA polymerase sigma-70 factor, ECF subfamily